jgi:hypothetical protein
LAAYRNNFVNDRNGSQAGSSEEIETRKRKRNKKQNREPDKRSVIYLDNFATNHRTAAKRRTDGRERGKRRRRQREVLQPVSLSDSQNFLSQHTSILYCRNIFALDLSPNGQFTTQKDIAVIWQLSVVSQIFDCGEMK